MSQNNHELGRTFWRADHYRLLALGFDFPSLPETLSVLASELSTAPWGGEALRSVLRDFSFAAKQDSALIEAAYHPLFTTHMLCSPCEGSYHQTERGAVIGDITAFYEAFRVKTVATQGPPDSIKMELGFMGWLCLKEAKARQEKNTEAAGITFEAERKFLCDHLGRWALIFADRLQDESPAGFYKILAVLLAGWIREECCRFQIAPRPLPVILPSAEKESGIQCAM